MTIEHDTDTTQAVIEAARALMRHVKSEIVVRRSTGEAWLDIWIQPSGRDVYGDRILESEKELPDTFFGNLVRLLGALEAHDEATIESEDA